MSALQITGLSLALMEVLKDSFPTYPKSLYKLTCLLIGTIIGIVTSEVWTLPAVAERAGIGFLSGLSATYGYQAVRSMTNPTLDPPPNEKMAQSST